MIRKLPRQARWAVPAGAVAAVALIAAGSALAGAQAAPQLPARSTAQLIAAVDAPPALPPAMQAVVQENASLGLPDLPGSGSSASDPLSGLSLLSGTHTFSIWCDGPTRVRIAIPVTLGEADLRRDGRNVWLWDSKTSQATHYVLPPGSASTPDQNTLAQNTLAQNAPTPQQAARQILAAVGQTTTVGLQPNVMVAGQAAYQLSLAPKDSRSLIGQVRIAIDARYSLPLRVQVFARGASSPALEVGFTSLSFARPAGSNFPFTPPPGAKVKTITVPAAGSLAPGLPFPGLPAAAAGAGSETIITQGSNGERSVVLRARDGKVLPARLLPATVVLPGGATCTSLRVPKAALAQMQASMAAQLPKGMPKAQRAALLKKLEAGLPGAAKGNCAAVSVDPAGQGWVGTSPGSSPSAMTGPTVMGKDWLSVVVLPGDASGLGGALLSAARPVHGSWGSGRLLRTSLISVLVTGSGQVLVGAVQPAVLYADAAQLR
jgi:outer membrane lipoprotein-sorting protein